MLQSISNGKKHGISLVSEIIIHTSLIAFGVFELINTNESLLYVIKLFGAVYLFYLAYQS